MHRHDFLVPICANPLLHQHRPEEVEGRPSGAQVRQPVGACEKLPARIDEGAFPCPELTAAVSARRSASSS
jgi:hypothetical protein